MKKFWYVVRDIVLTYMVQYLLLVGLLVVYIMVTGNYGLLEGDGLYKYVIIGITLLMLPITWFLYKKNKRIESRINYKKLLVMGLLGVSISLTYNMMTISMQGDNEIVKLSLPVLILYTAILGPVFEEIVFRYVSLNKAREVYNDKIGIVLVTVIFALMHSGIIGILYAFIIGMVLALVYRKYNNIMYPIVLHIFANFMSIFIEKFNVYGLILGVVGLLLSGWLIKKSKH